MLIGKKPLFSIGNWPIYTTRTIYPASLGLWIILTIVAIALTDLTPLDSVIAGLLALIIHWVSDIAHQYGHKIAADRVGYPSTGLTLQYVISYTMYPGNEGHLAPMVHIKRALGGPIMSIAIGLLLLIPASMMWPMGGMAQFLAGFMVLWNIFILGFGAFTPFYSKQIAFDGGTILHYWGQMRAKN